MNDEELHALLSDVEGEIACEAGYHSIDPARHSDGPVRHFMVLKCSSCELTGCLAICDGWVKVVDNVNGMLLKCTECGSFRVFYQDDILVRRI